MRAKALFQNVFIAFATAWSLSSSVAKSEPSSPSAQALPQIPPGKPGVIAFKEYTNSLTISVKASHERLFELIDPAVNISTADPSIAEFLIPNPNLLLLLGKKPGKTTMLVWDEAGRKIGINIVVEENVGCSQTHYNSHDSGSAVRGIFTTHNLVISECADPRPANFKSNDAAANPRALVAERLLEVIVAKQGEPAPSPAPSKPNHLPSKSTSEGWNYLPTPEPGYVFTRSGFPTGKTDKTIYLFASQSRTFETENKIVKVVTNNPVVAEPIVFGTTQFALFGKIPGRAQFEIQTDKGITESFELVVMAPGIEQSSNLKENDFKPPSIKVEPLNLLEHQRSDSLDLESLHQKFFKTDRTITRIATADRNHVEVGMVSTKEFVLLGLLNGQTTIAIWDDDSDVKKLSVCVRNPGGDRARVLKPNLNHCLSDSTSVVPRLALPHPSSKVEVWNGAEKEEVPVCTEEDLEGTKRPAADPKGPGL